MQIAMTVCDNPAHLHEDNVPSTETREITVGRTHYVMDLCAEDAERFDAALTPYVTVGSTTRTAAKRRRSQETLAIRTWARENGFEIADKGRISVEILDAYSQGK